MSDPDGISQPISSSFAQRLLAWGWNGINAFIGGVAGAGTGVGIGQALGALNFTTRQFWSMAIGAGLSSLFMYVRSHSLPEIFQTAETRRLTDPGTTPRP